MACRSIAGQRQILNQVYLHLLIHTHETTNSMYITDRDNRPQSAYEESISMTTDLQLMTVHNAKGGE